MRAEKKYRRKKGIVFRFSETTNLQIQESQQTLSIKKHRENNAKNHHNQTAENQ